MSVASALQSKKMQKISCCEIAQDGTLDFVERLAAGSLSLGARKGTVGPCCSLILATEHYLDLLFLKFPNAKENAKLDEIAPDSTSQLFVHRTSCSLGSILRSVSLHRPSHSVVAQELRQSSANCQRPQKRLAKVDFRHLSGEYLAAGSLSLGAMQERDCRAYCLGHRRRLSRLQAKLFGTTHRAPLFCYQLRRCGEIVASGSDETAGHFSSNKTIARWFSVPQCELAERGKSGVGK